MKSRYSILLGMVVVTGSLLITNKIFLNNTNSVSNLFVLILLFGGYITTYTSNIGKSRVALIAGIGVSILLITYQLSMDKSVLLNPLNTISFLIIPGFIMLIGGFLAKLTQKEIYPMLSHN